MTEVALPEVDYRRTSRRPAWSQLPRAVREAAGRVAGGVVARADPPVASGFSGAFAGRVTTVGGRQVFVKAGAPDQPHVVGALAQEAGVLDRLPAGIPAPELVGFATVDGWSVLVLGVVPGRMPGAPWTPAEVDAVHQACLTMAEMGTPTTVGGRDFAHRMGTDPEIVATGRSLLEGTFALGPELPAWLLRHGEHVGALVLDADGRFDGDTLCHGDLRPDNLLVAGPVPGPLTAVVVDWNWVGRAAPWVDWVGLLPLMAAQGVDTASLVRTSPLTRDVDPDDLDAFVAVIAAYMLGGYRAAPPPGCTPALREHQLLMAHAFLAFLRRRRRWS
ncbi:MAG: phosphotransferase [Lapillicoccus sp.]